MGLFVLEREIDSNIEVMRDVILVDCNIVSSGNREGVGYREPEVSSANQCIRIDSTTLDRE